VGAQREEVDQRIFVPVSIANFSGCGGVPNEVVVYHGLAPLFWKGPLAIEKKTGWGALSPFDIQVLLEKQSLHRRRVRVAGEVSAAHIRYGKYSKGSAAHTHASAHPIG
jgi:hypothetical protein